MTIDWINFTPWTALAGGVLIGAAAGLFVVLNGRIAGISGLLASLLERGAEGRGGRKRCFFSASCWRHCAGC